MHPMTDVAITPKTIASAGDQPQHYKFRGMQTDAIEASRAVQGYGEGDLQSMTSSLTSVLSGAAGSPAALTERGARLLPMGALALETDDGAKTRATGLVV